MNASENSGTCFENRLYKGRWFRVAGLVDTGRMAATKTCSSSSSSLGADTVSVDINPSRNMPASATMAVEAPLASRCSCFEHAIFTKVIFNTYFLSIISCFSYGFGLWMASLPSTGLTFLELGALYFFGNGVASVCGIVFGAIKSRVQGVPVALNVKPNDWRVYVTAIIFPLLNVGSCRGHKYRVWVYNFSYGASGDRLLVDPSIARVPIEVLVGCTFAGGHFAYTLCIDFADGAVVIFAPLCGKTVICRESMHVVWLWPVPQPTQLNYPCRVTQ